MSVIRVLSIDGGGMFGLLPLKIAVEMEKALGGPLSDYFHIMAGTSVGGIVAASLSSHNGKPIMSAKEAYDNLKQSGPKIFEKSLKTAFSMNGFLFERYDNKNLKDELGKTFGDIWLSDLDNDLIIPAYDIGNTAANKKDKTHFFKSWRARGDMWDASLKDLASERCFMRDHKLVDVLMSTTAAPTYFKPYKTNDRSGHGYTLIDGGLVANNPVMCGISAANAIYGAKYLDHEILTVSLSTGDTSAANKYNWDKRRGAVALAAPIVDTTLRGVSKMNNYYALQQPGSQVIRFDVGINGGHPGHPAPSKDMDASSPEQIERLEDWANIMLEENMHKFKPLIKFLKSAKMSSREELLERKEIQMRNGNDPRKPIVKIPDLSL